MSAAASPKLTVEQYLAQERASDVRHEFLGGAAWAMAGGTPAHARVKTALISALDQALRGKPCVAYDSDLKIHVAATGLFAYPDASVICGALERSTADKNAVVNPTLLVEVLSEGTADFDRSTKFAHYRRIPSLREVLFVSSDARTIEQHWRNDDGTWVLKDLVEGDAIVLRALDVTLASAELFARLEHAAEPPAG